MSRSFSDQEKNMIRTVLLEKGRELFARHGLKKTAVGELTAAAGIAQGSFYVFFNSKEELYFEILEMEEAKLSHTHSHPHSHTDSETYDHSRDMPKS